MTVAFRISDDYYSTVRHGEHLVAALLIDLQQRLSSNRGYFLYHTIIILYMLRYMIHHLIRAIISPIASEACIFIKNRKSSRLIAATCAAASRPDFLVWKVPVKMSDSTGNKAQCIPSVYRIFFLYLEPLASLVGAYYAFHKPYEYLQWTHAASTSKVLAIPLSTIIVLNQLSNLYFLFAINEALVLRATSDISVWRTLLLGLLVADVGHLYSIHPLGLEIYWSVLRWNPIDWGNIAFVYAGATMRLCFLAGMGVSDGQS